MDFKGNGILFVFFGLAVAVVLFVFLSTSDDDPAPSSPTVANETESTTEDVRTGVEKPNQEPERPEQKPDKPEEPQVPVIEVKGGQPVGGVAELAFQAGDQIRFTVESDIDENVHLHGYDIEQPVKAGGKTTFDLPASIEGVFELELEESVVPIAEITVNPS